MKFPTLLNTPESGLKALATIAVLGMLNVQTAYAADLSENLDETTASFYISGFIGAGFASDSDFSGIVTPPGGPQNVDINFDDDINFGLSVGTYLSGFGNETFSPRIEVELSYFETDADTLDFSGNGVGNENNLGGDISRTLLMANLLLDFNTNSALTPYIGAGIGVAFSDIDIVYGGPVGAPPPISFDDSDTDFAAQAIAGVSYAISDNTSIFVDGRYTRVFDVNGDRFNPGGFTGNIEDDFSNASVNVGVRVKF